MVFDSPSASRPSTIEQGARENVATLKRDPQQANAQLIDFLPTTVTTRRSQSPRRRSWNTVAAQTVNEQMALRRADHDDGTSNKKFFHASDALQTMKTSKPVQKKPAFFTANSFSTSAKTTHITPELRRAESANSLNSRTNTRPTMTKSFATRGTSPTRQLQGSAKLRPPVAHRSGSLEDSPSPALTRPIIKNRPPVAHRSGSSEDSPSPALTRPLIKIRQENGRTAASVLVKSDSSTNDTPQSSSVVGTPDQSRLSQSLDATPIIDSPAKEKLRPSERISDSMTSQASTSGEHLSPDVNLLSSPQSMASTASSLPRLDYFESAMSQSAQTNRKIMDLEIRTTSLLAVNNQLEKQTHKQNSEIKELRKKLILKGHYPADSADCPDDSERWLEDSVDKSRESEMAEDLDTTGSNLMAAASRIDQSIRRALLLSDQLLADAKKGLAYQPRESDIGVGIRKVLQVSIPDMSPGTTTGQNSEQDEALEESEPEYRPDG